MRGDHRVIRGSSVYFAAVLGLCSMGAADVLAQIANGNQWPKPRLTVLTPTGGKQGTTLQVGWTGSDLGVPDAMIFSHPGIKAVQVIPPPPKVDPKVKPDPKKPPQAPPITRFSVTIGKEVPPGFYDVRVVNGLGVSNPRVFVVDALEQVDEKEPNNDVEQAQKVELGMTISGTIAAGTDVDYCMFSGKKGQRVLCTCLGPSIDSRLHPEIRIFDASQKQLAYHRPAPGNDGVLDVTLPADGEYYVRLNQFTYTAGSVDYYYRLSLSTGPWIDAVFPPALEPGKPTQVTLYGRNLPGGKLDPEAVIDGKVLEKAVVTVTAPADPQAQSRLQYSGLTPPPLALLDGFEYRLTAPNGVSNPVMFTYARGPLVLENDANNTSDKAQAITVPCELAGRVDKRGDRDWYVFEVKKGQSFIIELTSNRLGAPTDMYFAVRNLEKKQDITLQDDDPATLSNKGFYTVTKDPPAYRFVAPEDGKYHLLVASHVSDLMSDPQHVYLVRITPEKPDFRLVVMPPEDYRHDTLVLGQGGAETFLVFCDRQDGSRDEIILEMEGLPPGVTCPPQMLAGAQKFAFLTVIAADNAAPFTGAVKVKGTAVINGAKVIREARPATITWPVQANQNISTITRLNRELMLAVRGKAPARLAAKGDKFVVSLGEKIDIPLQFVRIDPSFKGNFQVQPTPGDLPANVNYGNLTFDGKKDDQKATITVAANATPGTYNIVFRGFAPIAPDPKAKPVNTILPSTPVQLTILPKQVANLSVDNANPTLKPGADGVILVRVQRLFDYKDAFKVALELPKGVQGVQADPVTIGPGQNDVKLTLKVPANTPPGARPNIVIRALAVVNGNVTLSHETKINVNIVK